MDNNSSQPKKFNIIILTAILLLSLFLRLYKLDTLPPHLTSDEAALGYNAYSILKTGRDEHGVHFPLIFQSFGDYKPGLYIYLTIPFIKLLGLTEYAVRLPGALSGMLAVYLIYLLFRTLLENDHDSFDPKVGRLIPFFAALLLATNPWHLSFSRGAWEVNLALAITLAAVFFFLKGLRKPSYFVLSAGLFSLTLLTYQGAKLSSLIVLVSLVFAFRKELSVINRSVFVKPLIVGLLLSYPVITSMFGGQTGRLRVFSVFSYPRPESYLQQILNQGHETKVSPEYYLFHSESLNLTRGVLGRWFNHFSTRFLFFEGDWQNPQHSVPSMGVLILGDVIFLISGFYLLIKSGKPWKQFLLFWVLFAPLPAALSRDQVQAVRALHFVVPLVMITSLGMVYLGYSILFFRKKVLPVIIFVVFYLFCYSRFIDAYFIHLNYNSAYWFYGYREAVSAVQTYREQQRRIVFQQSYDQPYIFFLFYEKYDPLKYRSESKLIFENVFDVGLIQELDGIKFVPMSWPLPTFPEKTVIVVNNIAAPQYLLTDNYTVLQEISYPGDKGVAFRILEVK